MKKHLALNPDLPSYEYVPDGEPKERAQKRLKQAVENYNYRVGTGFLSPPFVLPMAA